jgi:cytochrome c-type biogenesis protein CcmH
MRDGRSNEAAQAYGRAVETGGATPQRLTNWGTALLAANDGLADKAATNAFREALRLDPDHARASFFLAESLRQAGEMDAARRRFEALAARGASAEPWSRAAREALASSAFTTGPS